MTEPRDIPHWTTPRLPILALLALLTAATLEIVRTTPPLLQPTFDLGTSPAAAAAITTYLAPGLLGVVLLRVTRGSDNRTVLLIGVLLLAAARLILQGLTGDVRFVAGMATIALALTVLTFAVSIVAGRPGGGRTAAGAMAFGAAAAVGVQLALGTWDAFWRHSLLGWSVNVLLLASLVACAVLARRDPATAPVLRAGRLWVLGPVLGFTWMMLANPAFASSQSGVRLVIAGPIAAVGLLLAGALVSLTDRDKSGQSFPSLRTATIVMAAAPAVAIAGILWATGALVLVLLVAAQLATVVVLAFALEPSPRNLPGAQPSLVRAAGSASLVGLGTILPLLLFQLNYRVPLGFPNELVLVAAAVVLGAAVVRPHGARLHDRSAVQQQTHSMRPFAALLAGAGVLVFVGSVIGAMKSDSQPTDGAVVSGPITLVSWNVHFGVGPTGDVDLEQIARSIEEQGPSIVTLQEVSRGWTMGGGADMATWLADRLEMRVIDFAPAADRQMGNAILTNLPTQNTTTLALPYGEGPQNRSAVSTDVQMEGGPVRVTSVHLQNKGTNTPTRLLQLETLLGAEGDAPVMIIAGDFNSQPGWPEIERMISAGLVSAQDIAGDPAALTDPSTGPVQRIDWVFGRGLTFTDSRVLTDALSSDHLPLVVTFTIGLR